MLKPLSTETIPPDIWDTHAPVFPADQLPAVLDIAKRWAVNSGKSLYVYQIRWGVSEGYWTCGADVPTDDPYLRLWPNGSMSIGCDGCESSGPTLLASTPGRVQE